MVSYSTVYAGKILNGCNKHNEHVYPFLCQGTEPAKKSFFKVGDNKKIVLYYFFFFFLIQFRESVHMILLGSVLA